MRLSAEQQQQLRERLAHEALEFAERDLEMAAEWLPLEEEAWRIGEKPRR